MGGDSAIPAVLRSLIARQARCLRAGDWERFVKTLACADPNFPLVAQYFTVAGKIGLARSHCRPLNITVHSSGCATVTLLCEVRVRQRDPDMLLLSYDVSMLGRRARVTKAQFVPVPSFPARAGPTVDFDAPGNATIRGTVGNRSAWLRRAGRCPDPHSLEEYVRACEGRWRYVETAPALVSALILANMMSPRAALIARNVYSPTVGVTLRRLFQLFAANFEHLENHPNPACAAVDFKSAAYETVDEMSVHHRLYGRCYGLCGALAALAAAVLRLCGRRSGRVVQCGLRSPYTAHDVLMLFGGGAPWLWENCIIRRWGAARFYEMLDVVRLATDAWWAGEDGDTSLSARELQQVLGKLTAHFPQFRFHVRPARSPGPCGPPLTLPNLLENADPRTIAEEIRKRVFNYSAQFPRAPATLAKYAYQTVLVRWPEVYAIRSARAHCPELGVLPPVPDALVRALGPRIGVDDQSDPYRIRCVDQVLAAGRGAALDRALLLATALAQTGHRAYCAVVGEAPFTLYTGPAGWEWRKGRDWRKVAPPGVPDLAFDADGAYYPAFDRYDVPSSLLTYLGTVRRVEA